MYDRILVPTDGSDPASAATEHALAVADRFGATVHALYVVDVDGIAHEAPGLGLDALRDALRTEGETATTAVVERAAERGVDVRESVVEGVAEDASEHGSPSPLSQAPGDASEHGSPSPRSQAPGDASEHDSPSPRSQAPGDAIVDYADAEGIDLIVMGTHGRRGLDRYLVGSVTERVVRRTEVPTLVVRGDGD